MKRFISVMDSMRCCYYTFVLKLLCVVVERKRERVFWGIYTLLGEAFLFVSFLRTG